MSYIVQRSDRFYVVAYDGLDPLTGRERRRWHPVGSDRGEAEELAERLQVDRAARRPPEADRSDSMTSCARRGYRTNAVRSERPRPTDTPGSSSTTSQLRLGTFRCDGFAPTTSTT